MSDPSKVRMTGPLVPYAAGFAEELRRQGYKRNSVASQMQLMAHLSRWMTGAAVEVSGLTMAAAASFLAVRRAEGYSLWLSAKALAPLMTYLRDDGVVPAVVPEVLSPAGVVLARFRAYLLDERGLGGPTAEGYVHAVRRFVEDRVVNDASDLVSLTAGDVTGFVLAVCPGRSTGSAKLVVSALRSLLGFLFLEGVLPVALADAVPSVAGWKLAGLPASLEPAEVRRLLAACDRRTGAGRRDFAMLVLLARLGLRAGEVRALSLDDIDWRAGEVVIRGKGNRAERLPLPVDVGNAVVAYLRHGRPPTAEGRSVFVRVRAPHRALSSTAVTNVVWRAAERAGLGQFGAHRLRHAAATNMVRAGASLPDVGQVLRHRLLVTTAIYAKVDRAGLRLVARSWPAGAA